MSTYISTAFGRSCSAFSEAIISQDAVLSASGNEVVYIPWKYADIQRACQHLQRILHRLECESMGVDRIVFCLPRSTFLLGAVLGCCVHGKVWTLLDSSQSIEHGAARCLQLQPYVLVITSRLCALGDKIVSSSALRVTQVTVPEQIRTRADASREYEHTLLPPVYEWRCGTSALVNVVCVEDWRDYRGPSPEPSQAREDDALCISFTSASSSGVPSPVVLSNAGIWARMKAYATHEVLGWHTKAGASKWITCDDPPQRSGTPADVHCWHTSLAFVDTIAQMLTGVLSATPTLVLVDKPQELVRLYSTMEFTAPDTDSHAYLGQVDAITSLQALLTGGRVTHVTVTPTTLAQLVGNSSLDLSTLRCIVSSGEALSWRLAADAQRWLRLCGAPLSSRLLNVYGATEVSADISCYVLDHAAAQLSSLPIIAQDAAVRGCLQWNVPVGLSLHAADMCIQGYLRPVAPHTKPSSKAAQSCWRQASPTGRICVRGQFLSVGFLHHSPFAAQEPDGYYRMGDIGCIVAACTGSLDMAPVSTQPCVSCPCGCEGDCFFLVLGRQATPVSFNGLQFTLHRSTAKMNGVLVDCAYIASIVRDVSLPLTASLLYVDAFVTELPSSPPTLLICVSLGNAASLTPEVLSEVKRSIVGKVKSEAGTYTDISADNVLLFVQHPIEGLHLSVLPVTHSGKVDVVRIVGEYLFASRTSSLEHQLESILASAVAAQPSTTSTASPALCDSLTRIRILSVLNAHLDALQLPHLQYDAIPAETSSNGAMHILQQHIATSSTSEKGDAIDIKQSGHVTQLEVFNHPLPPAASRRVVARCAGDTSAWSVTPLAADSAAYNNTWDWAAADFEEVADLAIPPTGSIPLDQCVDASVLVLSTCYPHAAAPATRRMYVGSHGGDFCCFALRTPLSVEGTNHTWNEGGRSHLQSTEKTASSTCETMWQQILPDHIEATACYHPPTNTVVVGCYDGCAYAMDVDNGDVLWWFDDVKGVVGSQQPSSTMQASRHGTYTQHLEVPTGHTLQGVSKRVLAAYPPAKRGRSGEERTEEERDVTHGGEHSGTMVSTTPVPPLGSRQDNMPLKSSGCFSTASGCWYTAGYSGKLTCVRVARHATSCSVHITATVPIMGSVVCMPTVSHGRVVVCSTSGHVMAFQEEDLTPLWQMQVGCPLFVRPVAVSSASSFLLLSVDGAVRRVNGEDGSLLWRIVISTMPVFATPLIVDGTAYITSHSGDLTCVDIAAGRVIWSQSIGSAVHSTTASTSTPVLLEGNATSGGYIFAINTLADMLLSRLDGTVVRRWRADLTSHQPCIFSSPTLLHSNKVSCTNSTTPTLKPPPGATTDTTPPCWQWTLGVGTRLDTVMCITVGAP